MARTRKRTPELRDHVLEVAVELLARDGVAGFTARRIAAAASTSTPAVYELFGDKSGLLREVFFAGFELLGARLRQAPERGSRAPIYSRWRRHTGRFCARTRCSQT